ncbi:MAG: potassium transporter TrkG [Candidatus Eremiobacterota bacterium]
MADELRSSIRLARQHRRPPRRPMDPALRLLLTLAAMVGVGTLLLRLPACGSHRALTFSEAFFTAVSALATTGLTVITPGKDLSILGQVVLLVLMQVGGVGYMVLAVVVFMLLGRHVSLAERLTLRDSLGLISTASLLRLVRYVLGGVVALELAGAALLWLLWMPTFGAAEAAYLALWHSVSAFCNASFDLLSGSPIAPAGFPQDAGTLLVISLLVVLGSLGVPVLSDLLRWPRVRRLSLHSRLTLVTAAFLLAVGTWCLFLGFSEEGLFSDDPWHRRLLMAWFHSSTARTSGFVLEDLSTMAPGNVLVLTVLMFVGGSPASMGGGITTSTFAILVLAMWTFVRGRPEVTFSRRTLPQETVIKAAAILTLAVSFVAGVSWLLLLTQEATVHEAVFETVSAFATCGFTLGLTPRLDAFGQFLIALTMFCGRLGVLTVVAALTDPSPSLVSYPEEKVLIG